MAIAQMPQIDLKLQYQLGIYYQFSMFYFVYPTIYVPAGDAWTLPNTEFSPLVISNIDEENSGCWKQTFAETILLKHCEESYKESVVCLETKKPSAPAPKQKTVPRDEDYQPELYISKKSKKSQQLENRNVVPNIIRLVLSFIQKKGKSCSIVEKLLKRSGVEKGWNIKRFYLYQSMIRGKMNNYVNEETLKNLVKSHPEQSELYSMAEQAFYNKITRTIIDYFLREEISVCVLTSKRMDKTKKTHHLNAIRNIRNSLPTILRQ